MQMSVCAQDGYSVQEARREHQIHEDQSYGPVGAGVWTPVLNHWVIFPMPTTLQEQMDAGLPSPLCVTRIR